MPDILGGRDQQAGGTWLALHRNGRFATVTNFRDAVPKSGKLRSRGHLITEFLNSERSPLDYLENTDADAYAGFNLLVSDGTELAYLSNRGGGCRVLSPGIYGVANAVLDSPWAKVERSTRGLSELIESGRVNASTLLKLLGDRKKASVDEVESGHLGFEKAHAMTAPFIVRADYGTRCSSVLLRDNRNRFRFTEVRFAPDGSNSGRSDFTAGVVAQSE